MTKKRIWALVLPFALAMSAMPAFAQDEEPPADDGTGTGDAPPGDETPPGDEKPPGDETPPADTPPADTGGTDMDMNAPGVYTKATWPLELTKRPITLAKGMLEIQGTIGINLAESAIGKPFNISPDIYYGVSDKLSVGLTHGTGLCLSGTDGGCAKVYNDVGVDAIFAFMTGNLNVGAHGGIAISQISDPLFAGLNVGVLVKFMSGKLAVTADPKVNIGLTERDFNKESLNLPVQIAFQATPKLAAFLNTGIGGPLDGFGDAFAVPVGVGALFALSNKLDVGGQFLLPLVAGGTLFEGATGAKARAIQLFVNFRM